MSGSVTIAAIMLFFCHTVHIGSATSSNFIFGQSALYCGAAILRA
jgi:hypothetical protein